ncbi:hypothetical protein DNTS_025325 [Danionella cerebrum]|uniref:Uncharacterized protein n=1 Tax=Danionella cerebrum TaxID=2873325 RepID=A0A553QWS6_9TELE|nr:hypothetical protein DNTS_025325 [Danionella translucida]
MKGGRTAHHPGKGSSWRPPRSSFGDHFLSRLDEVITQPYTSKAQATSRSRTKHDLIFEKRISPAPFHLPWRNNRIVPAAGPALNGGNANGSVSSRMQHSKNVDNGLFVDPSFLQTKEPMPSAKTRLANVLSQMNMFRTPETQKNSLNSKTSASNVESGQERGRSGEDIIQQSYTGSATWFPPYNPYRQEGAHMSSLDSDEDQEQSLNDSENESQRKSQLDDTEIESKTETGSDPETEIDTDTERASETEIEPGVEGSKDSSSEEVSNGIQSVQSGDSRMAPSLVSLQSIQKSTTVESMKSRGDHNEILSSSLTESYTPDPDLSFKTMSSFIVASSSVMRSLDFDKLPPIDEEGEMTGGSSSSSEGGRKFKGVPVVRKGILKGGLDKNLKISGRKKRIRLVVDREYETSSTGEESAPESQRNRLCNVNSHGNINGNIFLSQNGSIIRTRRPTQTNNIKLNSPIRLGKHFKKLDKLAVTQEERIPLNSPTISGASVGEQTLTTRPSSGSLASSTTGPDSIASKSNLVKERGERTQVVDEQESTADNQEVRDVSGSQSDRTQSDEEELWMGPWNNLHIPMTKL